MVRHRAFLPVVLLLAACSSPPPTLIGLGATVQDWRAHHGIEYTDVLTSADGRVTSFTLDMTPRSLAAAETLARRELPSDATMGATVQSEGVEGTKCEIVDYTSPTLRTALGSADVMAVFSTAAAVTLDPTQIDHMVVVSAAEHYPRAC